MRHGFLPSQYSSLRLHDAGRRALLLSDRDRRRLNGSLKQSRLPTEDKLLFSLRFGKVPDAAPRLLGMVVQGRFLPVANAAGGTSGLLALLAHAPVVVKPAQRSGGGRDVLVLSGGPDQPVVNGRAVSVELIQDVLDERHELSVVTT